jgi:peptidyl-dipeptidase Dcp
MTAAPTAIDLARSPLTDWTGPFDLPRFDQISEDDFEPMFDAALRAQEAEIAAIADNADSPTIENVLVALELSGRALARVSSVFWVRAGAHTSDMIQELERKMAPPHAPHLVGITNNEKHLCIL